jgi:membrane associated rhomboid family serine protease
MTTSEATASDERRFHQSILITATFVAVLWLIHEGAVLLEFNLVGYGIYPRRVTGLLGIAFGPLIHASLSHLIANSVSILILGIALLYGYPRSAGLVIGSVYVGSGLAVWLFARDGYHVGASGLTFGVMFFVFTIGAIRWDRRAIALSMIVFVLYGGMFWGIFPSDPDVSYESHFSGALLGVVLAILCRNRDPAPPEKRYDWEGEEDTPSDEEHTSTDEANSESPQGGAGPTTPE